MNQERLLRRLRDVCLCVHLEELIAFEMKFQVVMFRTML